jgi:hypothetical protein
VGVNTYHPFEESDVSRNQLPEGMDLRIEEVSQLDWVVKEENVGMLTSTLEGVTFKDSNQWEQMEVDAAEKRARNGTSGEEVVRKNLWPRPVVMPLNPGMTGQALSEVDVVGRAPRPKDLPGKEKCQRTSRGEVNPIQMMWGMAKFSVTASFRDTEVRELTWGQSIEDCPTAH